MSAPRTTARLDGTDPVTDPPADPGNPAIGDPVDGDGGDGGDTGNGNAAWPDNDAGIQRVVVRNAPGAEGGCAATPAALPVMLLALFARRRRPRQLPVSAP